MPGYAANCVQCRSIIVGLLFWKTEAILCPSRLLPNVVNNGTAGHKSDGSNVTYWTLAAMFFSDTKELLNFTELSWSFFSLLLTLWSLLKEVKGGLSLRSSYGHAALITPTALHGNKWIWTKWENLSLKLTHEKRLQAWSWFSSI